MEKKLKNIIIALVVLLAISFFIIFNIQSSKLTLLREYNETKIKLTQEKEEAINKLNDTLAKSKDLQDRLELVQKELERITKERDELESKYQTSNKEKEELQKKIEELKAGKKKTGIAAPTPEEMKIATMAKAEEAYWAEVLKSNADLKLQVESLTKKLEELRLSNQELQNDKADAELRISELNQERRELQRKLQYNEKLLNSISAEMVREKNEKNKLEKDLIALKEQNRALRRKANRLDRQRIAFAERLSKLTQEKERLIARIEETESLLGEKTTQMEHMHQELEEMLKKVKAETEEIKAPKESVELPTIVVSSPPVIEIDRLEGKVLTVDKEHAFVVIDLGRNDGVDNDMVFEVVREDNVLGQIKVIQLREEISACDIIKIDIPFQTGDTVRLVRN